ncbi:hypothetical protein FOL47_004369 [Perkinsus chesapeaki]|uniref:K Homology domain-containing protein n=1 Tax=Perkinsus chesapeaki TaxID=330153 RepID=A0A7J6M2T7_PERCH|nr:hypothetical protein FOL47_004369 [Perkinsus chesapeaki]
MFGNGGGHHLHSNGPIPLNLPPKSRVVGGGLPGEIDTMGVDTRYSPPVAPPLPPPLHNTNMDVGPPTRGPDGYSWENLVFETIDPNTPSLAVNLPVPLDRAGLVVGVRGNTVRGLEAQCGVEISVAVRDDDPLRDPSTNTTHVHVRGPKYGVYEAMQRISDLFRYRNPLPDPLHTLPTPTLLASSSDRISQQHQQSYHLTHHIPAPPLPTAAAPHHSAYEADPESISAIDKPNLISFDILDDHCGLVIGKRGRMLADLRDESGASIELISGDDPTQPKKCLVWSTSPDKVDDALVRLARVLSRLPDALPVPPPKNPQAEERALNPRWVDEDFGHNGPALPGGTPGGGLYLPRGVAADIRMDSVPAAAAAAVAISYFDSREAVDACAPHRDTPLDTPVEYYVDVPADKVELLTDRTMQDLRRRSQCYVEVLDINVNDKKEGDALMWRRLMLYGMPVSIHYAIVKLKDIMKGEVVDVGEEAIITVKDYPKIGEGDYSTTTTTQYSRMQDEADAEKGEKSDYIKTEGVHQRVFRWGIGNRFRAVNANRYQPVHLERVKEVTLNNDYYDSPDTNIRWDDFSECWEVYWYENEKLNAKPFPVKKFGIKWSKEEAKKFYNELKEDGRVHARPSHKSNDDSIMWDERMQGWTVSYWQNGR